MKCGSVGVAHQGLVSCGVWREEVVLLCVPEKYTCVGIHLEVRGQPWLLSIGTVSRVLKIRSLASLEPAVIRQG